jgi:hypothetical protein
MERAHWRPVPPNHAIVVSEGEKVHARPFLFDRRVAAE